MDKITEIEKELDVVSSYDVVVCGGGIAGISAALASARQGAKTLLIEREFILGGLATAGLIAIYLPLCDGMGRQVSFGIAEELLKLSIEKGYEEMPLPEFWQRQATIEERKQKRYEVQYNPQIFALLAEQLLLKEKVDLLYGTVVCNTILNNGKITHLVTENKSGRQAIAVKSVVDATGDADIVHLSGEKEGIFSQGNVLAGWYYELYNGKNLLRMLGACDVPEGDTELKKPALLTNRRFSGLDGKELSEQVVLSHSVSLSNFLSKGNITESHSMVTLPTIPQIRMTRRIDGITVMDDADMHKEFSDSVGLFSDWRKKGPVYELRFSALHSEKIKNLICAGRNISATDAMWDITRVIPVCAVSGEAAGVAAAISDDFTKTDYEKLSRILKDNGVKLHEREL